MSFGQFAEVLTIARKVNNWEEDPVTGVKELWESTQSFKAVVPAGVRWFVLGGVVKRNVSSTVSISGYDSAGKIIFFFDTQSAAASTTGWPTPAKFPAGIIAIMDPGEWVRMIFGTAQDAGSNASCVVLEIPYP